MKNQVNAETQKTNKERNEMNNIEYKAITKEQWKKDARRKINEFVSKTPAYECIDPDFNNLFCSLNQINKANIESCLSRIGQYTHKYFEELYTGEFISGHYVSFGDVIDNRLTDDSYDKLAKANSIDLSHLEDDAVNDFYANDYIADIVFGWVNEVIDEYDVKKISSLLKGDGTKETNMNI